VETDEMVHCSKAQTVPEELVQSGIIKAMSGNTFGHLFAVTNFGESHGPAIA